MTVKKYKQRYTKKKCWYQKNMGAQWPRELGRSTLHMDVILASEL
jgi:hypothetical protein